MGISGASVAPDSSTPGRFVISLDFELHWGVRDLRSIDSYRTNLQGVREVVPRLLECFDAWEIHATWATVGFLMAEDRDELLNYLPDPRPRYEDARLDPYRELESLGQNEQDDPFHYAPSLVALVAAAPRQELATHTFSHFYALEPGATDDAFAADLDTAIRLAKARGIELTSIVFPRNQVTRRALAICHARGLTAFRGTEVAWYQQPRPGATPPASARALRLLDAYVRVGTDHLQSAHEIEGLVNVPQSRFLRSCRGTSGRMDDKRLSRIKGSMTRAAQSGQIFHLWWHPHGFGAWPDENLEFLGRVLAHYRQLHDVYGFRSLSMREVADEHRAAVAA